MSIYFPASCAHVCVHPPHTHTQMWHAQNQWIARAPEPTPGCVTTHSPSEWTARALALAQDAGQALADSSGPLTYLYSHFTELETEAQADGHRASEQDSEIQVTETGTGQGGPQMESEANGGKGPPEVT